MTHGGPDPRIAWIVEYMHKQLARPPSTAQLARHVGLSPSRFRALFAKQTGTSPVEYLQQLRLRRARLLIERTFLSVEEIMTLVGYDDASKFARDFQREYELMPHAIRGSGIVTPICPVRSTPRSGGPVNRAMHPVVPRL